MSNTVFEHGYALLIGVGADLPVTAKDATGLRDILVDSQRCAYPPKHVQLLTEGQATRKGILSGLTTLQQLVQNDSEATVIVYFSGHGGLTPEYHLVPFGYKTGKPAETAISGNEFAQHLKAISAKKLLVLLDCCHAGGMATIKSAEFIKSPAPPELSGILSQGGGRVLIASSRRDEVSYTGIPYSVFTQALREALSGYGTAEQDGYAYIADVAMYVGRMVPNRTKDQQHPILKLAAADNFAVAHYAGGSKSPIPLCDSQASLLPIASLDMDTAKRYQRVLEKLRNNLLLVEERMAEFIDEAAIPLDLERTKKKLLKRIVEKEAEIEKYMHKTG